MKRNNQYISQRYYTYLSTFVLLMLMYLFFTPVKMEAAPVSLGIYPPLIKIRTQPDNHIQQQITVSNYGDDPTIVTISFKMFQSSANKNGQVTFLPTTNEVKNFFSEHVKVLDSSIPINQVLLAPQQHKSLTIDITTPKEQVENDYYFSILFIASNPTQTKSNVSIVSNGIATNILLTILTQPQREQGYIKQFDGPRVIDKEAIPFVVEVANQGNQYIDASGKINITNMLFGSKDTLPLQPTVILANSSRYMRNTTGESFSQAVWNHGFLFGIYRADLEIHFGKTQQTFHRIMYFYSYPLLSFAIGTGVIIFIGMIAFKIYKKRG